jgi:hypothetical protein
VSHSIATDNRVDVDESKVGPFTRNQNGREKKQTKEKRVPPFK